MCASLVACSDVDETYKKYQPADSKPRAQESIDWSRMWVYDARDTKLPRVLMIGDSICNANHKPVRNLLKDKFSVGTWCSSMNASDPDFIYALNLVLEQAGADVITFNNALHPRRHLPAQVVYDASERAVKFIMEKCPKAKLIIVGATPLRNEERTAYRDMDKIAKKFNLPFVDLDALMSPLDRTKNWSDNAHFKREAIEMQGKAIADAILKTGVTKRADSYKKFSPAPVIAEDEVINLMVGMNTKDTKGKRVIMAGKYVHDLAWKMRKAEVCKFINCSGWTTSKCVSDPDFLRHFDYYMSLLDFHYLLFVQPPNAHKSGAEWADAFAKTMAFVKEKYPSVKILLCGAPDSSAESKKNAASMRVYAEKNKIPYMELGADKLLETLSTYILKNAVEKNSVGGLIQKGTKTGPSGEIK